MLTDSTHAVMDKSEFNNLLEYSASLPSGTFIGKKWKRNCFNGTWVMGEYVEHDDPKLVKIIWREILLVD